MKNKLYHVLSVGGTLILLALASGYAQASVAMKATIPFAFKVQNETLPPGDYTISFARNESKEAVWIKNRAVAACAITIGHVGKRMKANPYLVFNRYGEQYFLSQVWTSDSDVARVLFMSRSEREILRATPGELAHHKISPTQVMIAAR